MPLDCLQVLIEVCRSLNCLTQVFPVQPLPFVLGKLPGSKQRVSDLPPVHFMCRQFVKSPFQLGHVRIFVLGFLNHVEEVAPDRLAGFLGQVVVMDRNLDSGLESLVEGADAIRGQDEYAIVVLERAEEYCGISN